MAVKKTTFKDRGLDHCEIKKFTLAFGDSTVGRTEVFIDCPFCGVETLAYMWSLCGGGKRCTNENCYALFTGYGNAYRLKDEFHGKNHDQN